MTRSQEDRHDREARRCLRDEGEFRHGASPLGRILRRAEVSDAAVERVLARHREHADRPGDPAILKVDHRAVVTAVETPAGSWCVKEFRRPGLRRRLEDALRGSRARHAWLGAHACVVRGLPTPRPLAIVEGRGRSWFVNELVTGAVALPEWVVRHRPASDAAAARRWRRLVEAIATLAADLHASRLHHRDLSAKNVLVRETDAGFELFLLDLSDIRLGRFPSRRERIRSLGQLVQIPVEASRSDARRFYQRYAERHPDLDDPAVWAEIAAIARARQERWLAHGGRDGLAPRPSAPGGPDEREA